MSSLVTAAWGPGVIGLGISGVLYGTSLAQSLHYVWFFPKDPLLIKSLVLLVFISDIIHLIGTSQFYWVLVVLCHRSVATSCVTDLPWGAYIAVPINYFITFTVQGFYCHRIWIITDGQKVVTLIAALFALLQFGIGLWASAELFKKGTIEFLFTTPLIPLAAGVSTLCDVVITSTIFKHLWRSELRRTNVIRDLVIVFVNMGALTCVISITVGVVFLAQGDHYWVGAPAVILSRCYANSFLAVLNARRRIRERELRRLRYSIEIPTLATIR